MPFAYAGTRRRRNRDRRRAHDELQKNAAGQPADGKAYAERRDDGAAAGNGQGEPGRGDAREPDAPAGDKEAS
ncbi:hypothetical protein DFLDMN_004588 [Cupriavidus sp. H19C3]|nr:MAG: hypothetical protein E6Q40_15865 [Cupriavidus sp.]